VPVSRNFCNSLLAPRFVQLFSGNSSISLLAMYGVPLQIQTFYKKFISPIPAAKHKTHNIITKKYMMTDKQTVFIKILSSSLNTAVTSAVMNFRCHKLIASKCVKEQSHGEF